VTADSATLASLLVSEMKAETAAKTGYPTLEVGEWAYGKDGKPPCCRGIEMVPGFIAFPGGLPIKTADGALIGGIGVCGGPPNIDEECAHAGLDRAKDMLKCRHAVQ
jgi:glc operon protein GlcG